MKDLQLDYEELRNSSRKRPAFLTNQTTEHAQVLLSDYGKLYMDKPLRLVTGAALSVAEIKTHNGLTDKYTVLDSGRVLILRGTGSRWDQIQILVRIEKGGYVNVSQEPGPWTEYATTLVHAATEEFRALGGADEAMASALREESLDRARRVFY